MNTFPRRGEIWLVNWNPARGSEQAGIRPALIVQNNVGNENSSTDHCRCHFCNSKVIPDECSTGSPSGWINEAFYC